MAAPKVDWCFVSDGGRTITCDRCGKSHQIDLPMSVSLYTKFLDAFGDEHKHCKEKDTEPK